MQHFPLAFMNSRGKTYLSKLLPIHTVLTEVEVEGTGNVAPPVLPEFELPEINQQTAQPRVYESVCESYNYENPE